MSNRLKGIIMGRRFRQPVGASWNFYSCAECGGVYQLGNCVSALSAHWSWTADSPRDQNPQVLRVGKQGVLTSIIFGVLTYTAGFLGYAFSIERIPVAMSAVLSFMSPVWVCLIGLVVFRERVQRKQVISIAFCLLGAVLITNLLGVQEMRFDMLGMLAAILNGVGIAAQVSVPRYFSGRYERDTMLTYGFLGASAFMALFVDHGKNPS